MNFAESTLSVEQTFKINYGDHLEAEITYLKNEIAQHPEVQERFPTRWVAIKLLEEDRDLQIKLLGILPELIIQLPIDNRFALYSLNDYYGDTHSSFPQNGGDPGMAMATE